MIITRLFFGRYSYLQISNYLIGIIIATCFAIATPQNLTTFYFFKTTLVSFLTLSIVSLPYEKSISSGSLFLDIRPADSLFFFIPFAGFLVIVIQSLSLKAPLFSTIPNIILSVLYIALASLLQAISSIHNKQTFVQLLAFLMRLPDLFLAFYPSTFNSTYPVLLIIGIFAFGILLPSLHFYIRIDDCPHEATNILPLAMRVAALLLEMYAYTQLSLTTLDETSRILILLNTFSTVLVSIFFFPLIPVLHSRSTTELLPFHIVFVFSILACFFLVPFSSIPVQFIVLKILIFLAVLLVNFSLASSRFKFQALISIITILVGSLSLNSPFSLLLIAPLMSMSSQSILFSFSARP